MKTLLLGISFAIALGAAAGCSSEKKVVRHESVTSMPVESTTTRTTTTVDQPVVERRTTERRTTTDY